jgi:hypothetical protein
MGKERKGDDQDAAIYLNLFWFFRDVFTLAYSSESNATSEVFLTLN